MTETGFTILKIPKTGGAYAYGLEARSQAINSTGAGGYLNAKAVASGWHDIEFATIVGAGVTIPLSIGSSVPANLFSGASTVIGGSTPNGDLRAEADGYLGIGNTSPYNFLKGQDYSGAFFAVYKGDPSITNSDETGKIGIGTSSTPTSYYEGSFTTRNIYEFETSFTADSTDLTKTTTGSGVYTEGADITLQFSILNRNGELLSSASQIAADPFVSGQRISILNTDGSVAFADYRIGGDSIFNFSRSQNVDVFGSYTRNLGIRSEVVNQDGGVHTSEFYLYANTATFDKVFVKASGETVLNENYTNHSPPNTGSITTAENRADAIKYFNNQPVNNTGVTGFIELDLGFNENINYVNLGDLVLYYGTSGELETNRGTLVGNYPLNSIQEGQKIRLTANDGIPEGTGLFFKLAADTEVGFNEELFTIGPFTLEPENEGPDLNLYNQGDQTLVGDFTIEAGLEGDDADGGNLNVSGNALGTGDAGRLTGPSGLPYLLTGDAAGGGGSDDWQDVLDRGNSTTTNTDYVGAKIIFNGDIDKSISYSTDSPEGLLLGADVESIKSAHNNTFILFPNQSVAIGASAEIIGASPATGSAVLGGTGNIISGHFNTLVGGAFNVISGETLGFNFIGGGSGIDITNTRYSAVVGGYNNDIKDGSSEDAGFIGGGRDNLISGASVSVIAGGHTNKIAGGNKNIIVGGDTNTISGSVDAGSIAGGVQNKLYGSMGFIGAGGSNTLYGQSNAAAILGGVGNRATGDSSTTVGGYENLASGAYALAAGRKAIAGHEGSMVFADGQNRDHNSSGEHTATLDFAGGVYVPTSGMFGQGLFVSGVPVLTGENNPAEADTLQTVTDRGATSTNAINVSNTVTANLFTVANEGKVFSTSTLGLQLQANSTDKPIIFSTNSGGMTERMRITRTGVGIGVPDPMEMLELGAGGKIGLTDSAGTYDSVIYNDGSTFKVADGSGSYHVDKINLLGLLDLGVGHTIKGIGNSIIANKDILAPKDGSFGFRTYGATNQYDAISSQFIDNNNNALSFNVKAGGTTSEAFRIDKDGNIGVDTTAPLAKLDVRGDISGSGNFLGTGVGNRITNNGTPYLLSGDAAAALTLQDVCDNGNTTTTSILSTGPHISGVTGLYSDKVGIGTSTPTQLLDVYGSESKIALTSSAGRNTVLQQGGGHFHIKTSHTNGVAINNNESSAGRLAIYEGLGENIRFASNGNSWITGGNVGIGTTDPDRTLHVKGIGMIEDASSTAYGTLQFGTNTSRYIRGNSAELQVGSTIQQLHFQNTSAAGQIASSAANGTDAIQILARTVHTSANILEVVNGNGAAPIFSIDYTGNVEVTGSIYGTGAGNRITKDGIPYLLSGDSPAENDTLQTVTDRGNITTTDIKAAHISGSDLTISGNNNKFVEIVRTANNNPANLNEFSNFYSLSIKNRDAGSLLNFGGRGEYSDIQATDGAASATAKNIVLNPYGGRIGVGSTSPDATLQIKAGDTTGFLVQSSADKNILWAENSESVNARAILNVYHTTVASRYLQLGWGSVFANDNDNELTLGSNYSSNSATRIFVAAESADNTPPNTIQMQANHGLAVFSGVSTDTFEPTALIDVRGDGFISGSVKGTGAGNRITNNHIPYLLSGDSPAENDTLQDVTTRGNSTNTSIISTGPHISGGTGLFEDVLAKGAFGIHGWQGDPDTHMKGYGDRIVFTAGGLTFADFSEGSQDLIHFNGNENQDIDFRVGYDGGPSIFSRGSDGKVGIANSNPQQALDVSGSGVFSEKVGIGTNNPSGKLEINTSLSSSATLDMFQSVVTSYPSNSDIKGAYIELTDDSNAANTRVYGIDVDISHAKNHASNRIYGVHSVLDGTAANNQYAGYFEAPTANGYLGDHGDSAVVLINAKRSDGGVVGDILRVEDSDVAKFTIVDGGDVHISGDVGIGTASPSSKLHVESTNTSSIRAYNGSRYAAMGANSNAAWITAGGSPAHGLRLSAGANGAMSVYASRGVAIGEYPTTDPGADNFTVQGNVGLGVTTALAKLDVRGDISGSGSFLGTGVGNRITNNGTPYLLSGDAAAALTLQDVCDNGNTTTTSIVSTGPHISGTTGLFENAKISNFNSSDYAAFGHENVADSAYAIRQHSNGNTHINCGNSRLIQFRHLNSTQGGFTASKDFFVGPSETDTAIFVDESENSVGIGTYSPARNLSVASSTTNALIQLANSTTTYAADNGLEIFISDNDAGIVNRENGYLRFDTNNLERVRIEAGGDVGIGTNNPSEKLTVSGNALLYGDNKQIFFGGANTYVGELSNSQKLQLRGGGSNSTHTAVLDSAGRLGLATTVPQVRLHLENSDGTDEFLRFSDSAAGDVASVRAYQQYYMGNNTTRVGYFGFTTNETFDMATTSSNGALRFIAGNNAVAMKIKSDGKVGIGTETPLTLLDVRGDISGSGSFLGTGVGNRITNNGTPYLLSGDSPAETQTLQDVCDNGSTTTTSVTIGDDLAVDTDTLFVDASTDRVGINRNSLTTYDLEVRNGAGGSSSLGIIGGSASSLVLNTTDTSIVTVPAAQMFLRATGGFYFQSGTTTKAVLTKEGDFGIGTDSPSARLHVAGGNILVDSQYGIRFNDYNTRIYTNSETPEDLLIEADQDLHLDPDGVVKVDTAEFQITSSSAYTTHLNYNNAGSNFISQANGGATQFRNSAGTLMQLNSNGNLSVGAASDTTTRFFVTGAVSNSLAKFKEGSDGIELTTRTSNGRQQIDFLGTNTSSINAKGSLFINYDTNNDGGNDTISFTRNGADEAGTLDMIIKEGDVGIGIAAPQSKLHVAGDIRVDNAKSILGETNGGGNFQMIKIDTSDNMLIGDGNLVIDINGTSERMKITSAGNVLIGQPTDSVDKLQTQGAANLYAARFNGSTNGSQSYGVRIRAGTTSVDHALLIENTAGSDLFIVKGDGNIGVGLPPAAAPLAKLDVRGSISGSGSFLGTGDGSRITNNAGLPYLVSGDEAGATNTLQDVCDNGSTTTTAVNISGAITVADNIFKNVENSFLGLYGGSDTLTNDGFIKIHGNSNNWGKVQTNIGYDATNSKAHWTLNNTTELMTLKGDGYLGIGTVTPSGKLDVAGDGSTILLHSNDYKIASIHNRGTSTNLDRGGFSLYNQTVEAIRLDSFGDSFINGGSVGIGIAAPAAILNVVGHSKFNGTSYHSHFNYATDGTEDTFIRGGKAGAKVYINDSHNSDVLIANGGGNVGIGTVTPARKLDVSTSASDTYGIRSSYNASYYMEMAHNRFNTVGNNYIRFNIDDATKMTIVDSDFGGGVNGVGIGITNPTAELQVIGDISGSGSFLGTGVGNRITNNGVPYLLSGDEAGATNTLQDVCDNGNTTTTSILSSGPYISGVTGLFEGTMQVKGANSWAGADTQGGSIYISTEGQAILGNMGSNYARPMISSASNAITIGSNGTSAIRNIKYHAGNGAGTADSEHNFYTSGNNVRLHIAKDGKVGIGSTSPARKLNVVGDAEVSTNLVVGTALYTNQWIANTSSSQYIKNNSAATSIEITNAGNVGIGSSPTNKLDVFGHFSATSKSFLIDHPTKENKKLQYGSLEGPENGVYVRGTTDKETIELPEYWSELVHDDSITVVLTPIGKKQDLFIIKKSNKLIKIGGVEGSFDYVVYGERKDIDRLEIEPDGN